MDSYFSFLNSLFRENYHLSIHMASWKESMINRLSNLINCNHSAAKISQVLCSDSYVPGFVRQCLEFLLPASWQECFPFHSEDTNDCLQLCTFSILPLEFVWQSLLANMVIILTCSRLSILLSNKLWAFAGGRPSKSQQRLLNHTFTSWLT